MRLAIVPIAFLTVTAVADSNSTVLETNLQIISRLWGEISNYADNAPNAFGVQDVGLPDGCQVEQAHLLQRHAQRFPTSLLGCPPVLELFPHSASRRR